MTKKKYDLKYAILFLSPSLVGFTIFYLIPFIASIYYSVIENSISYKFVGLANFGKLITNEVFQLAITNTLRFTLISVPLIIIFSLLLAIYINKIVDGKDFLLTSTVIPLVIPVAAVSFFWETFFTSEGILDSIFRGTGKNQLMMLDSDISILVLIIIYIWRNIGFNIIVFLAALRSIPENYIEEAKLMGASFFQRLIYIMIPRLVPSLFFVSILSIINSFKIFRESFLIFGNYPNESIYMLQHFINNQFAALNYQKITTAAILFFFIIVFFLGLIFKTESRWKKENFL